MAQAVRGGKPSKTPLSQIPRGARIQVQNASKNQLQGNCELLQVVQEQFCSASRFKSEGSASKSLKCSSPGRSAKQARTREGLSASPGQKFAQRSQKPPGNNFRGIRLRG